MRAWVLGLWLAMLGSAAIAQSGGADVGLVNLLSGEVQYAARGAAAGKAQAYMRVREGDRFTVPAGASVRIVYFESARQERWNGPASFRTGRAQGEPIAGSAAEVTNLPASVPKRIARIPELLQNAKLGGVQVRSAAVRPPPRSAEDERLIAEARSTYAQMRAQAAGDDIGPELFLYSALSEYAMYPDMKLVVEEMQRRQPDSEQVRSLAAWIETRLRR